MHLTGASVLAWLNHHRSLLYWSQTFLYSADIVHIFLKSQQINIFAYLVFWSSNGFREGKERQGQVHEAIFVGLQLLVSFDNLEELQAH